MNVVEFLDHTEIREPLTNRPRIFCKDGFNVSCQFGYNYSCNACDPQKYRTVCYDVGKRRFFNKDDYKTVELGYPSEKVDIWMDYAEWEDADVDNDGDVIEDSIVICPTRTVYNRVPVEEVQKVLDMHGGIDVVKTFVQ